MKRRCNTKENKKWKKRRMIDRRTPEEKAAQEARYQELLRLIERAKIELPQIELVPA